MPAHSMLRVAFAGLALLAAAGAHAAEIAYPTKPIRLLIPFPPGGSADPLGRALGVWFSDKFGVPVVADNRPGAGTAIAHTLGAKAVPDGYTLLLGASSGLTTNPALGNKLDYDPIKSYAPVGLAAYVPAAPGRSSVGGGEELQRAHRAREDSAGQDQLRLARCRDGGPSEHRAVQRGDRRQIPCTCRTRAPARQ